VSLIKRSDFTLQGVYNDAPILSYEVSTMERPDIGDVIKVGKYFSSGILDYRTAYVVYWSHFLAADPEVPSSIPGAARFSE
jgi:hypothetical protein